MWVKLHDGMPDDPAVDHLSDGAFRLYVSALCYSARELTDGYVSAARVPRLMPRYRPSYVAELAAAGLWLDDLPGGYSIRNWDKYNQSREYWEDRHAKEAARIAEFRARKKAEREGLS